MPENESSLNDAVNQVLGVLARRRWWVLAVACGTALATIAVTMQLPDRYASEATLIAVQQQISQRYVEPGNTTTPAAEVQAMARQVLSRSRLTGIIEELGLYAKERQVAPIERLAERMQNEVEIEPLDDAGRNDFRAFKITFTAGSPQLAQATTSRLTSLFIEENLKARGEQATRTNKFLTEQMEAAKRKVAEQSVRLQDYKMHNLSELPEQQQANLGTLTDLRIQLQTTVASLNRAQIQRTSMESTISGNLAALQTERSSLLARFTPKHPDVVKKDEEIAAMQALLDRLKTGNPGIVNPKGGALPPDPVVSQWASQVDANASDTENLNREEQRLRGEIAKFQDRMTVAPVREQELAGILRDYDTYNKEYTDLQNKQLQSQLAVSLEQRQEGQQFRLVDPPTLPLVPSSPNRVKICLGGAGAGIFLGLVLAFLIDIRNPSFHGEKELRRAFSIPIVLGVPFLITPAEERSRTWKRVFEWAAGGAMVLAICAAEFYVYRSS